MRINRILLPRVFSIAASGLLLAGMLVEVLHRPSPADAAPFHHAAAVAIQDIPYRLHGWDGVDAPVPASAQALLRPNALLARRYIDSQTGRSATLIIVQCADTRDMAGHYPPICYPSSGWEKDGEIEQVPLQIGTRTIIARRYAYKRETFEREVGTVVYGFFAVPAAGFPADMEKIRSIASDYTSRPFGAAQIQVVLGSNLDRAEEITIVEAMLSPLQSVLDLLSDPAWRRK